jgi:signal transduction histidine kinase
LIIMAQTQETLETLLEVGRLLSSKLDLPELLQTVLELAARVVDAESASLLLVDEKTGELYFDVALGLGEQASKIRLRPGQGIAGAVAKTLKPEIINDAPKDPRWSPAMDEMTGFKTRSILAVPMRIKGKLVGVVEAINKRGGDFSDEDVRTFEGFAAQAAVALENARLFSSLREERFKLQTVFSEMSDAAVLADGAGQVLLANPAAKKLLELADGAPLLEQALEPFLVFPPLRQILANTSSMADFEAAREKPVRLMLAGRATRIEVGWLLVFRDVTEAWQKEKLKRSFLSLISHKLKTPLASVTGYSDILLEEFRANPPKSAVLIKSVETIQTQGRKLADLVDKLLRYTTLEENDAKPAAEPCPLDAVIDEAAAGMKDWLAEHGGSVLHEAGPAPVVVMGDRAMLVEVVKNLIENAVKFDAKPQKKVAVWVEKLGQEAVLRVKDEGPGIPPEEMDRLFTRFHQIETYFTGQIDGWGLGLAYVKKIVEAHKGRVEIRSKLGEGTTATVRLPL